MNPHPLLFYKKLDCPLLLRHLPLSCMQPERVLLLKRLGRHEDVLTMLM